jgi:hypothetical protein
MDSILEMRSAIPLRPKSLASMGRTEVPKGYSPLDLMANTADSLRPPPLNGLNDRGEGLHSVACPQANLTHEAGLGKLPRLCCRARAVHRAGQR